MTTAKSEIGAIQACSGALCIQVDPGIIAHPGPTHCRRGGFQFRGSCNTRKQPAYMESALGLILYTAIIQRGAFFQDDFGQRIAERAIFCAGEMALNHTGAAACAQRHEISRQTQKALTAATRQEYQFNGLVQFNA